MSNVVSLLDVKIKKKMDKDNYDYDLTIVKDAFRFKHFLNKLKPDKQRILVVYILNISQGMKDRSVFIPPYIVDVFYWDKPLDSNAIYLLFGYVTKLKSKHDKKLVEMKISFLLENNESC